MNVIVFGYGNMSKRHINFIKKTKPNSKFYIIKKSKNKIFLKNHFFFNNYSNLLKNKIFDFGLICTPSKYHYKYIKLLHENEVNFFVEKPLCKNKEELIKLKKLKKKNILKFTGYNCRFLKSLSVIKKIIDRNKDPLSVEIVHQRDIKNIRKNLKFTSSIYKSTGLGGDILLEFSHEIDICRMLFGEPKKIYSSLNYTIKNKVLSDVKLIFKYKNFSVSIIMNYHSISHKRKININYPNKEVKWDGLEGKIYILNKNNTKKVIYDNKKEMYESYFIQIQKFLKLLDKKNKTSEYFDSSLKTQNLILKAYNV